MRSKLLPSAMKAVFFSLIAGLFPASSFAATINFDSLPSGTFVTNQFQNLGVVFSSGDGKVYASDFAGTFPTNVILGTRPGQVTDAELVEVIFVDPSNTSSPGICNSLTVSFLDLQLAGNGMYAYDINGNLLGSVLSTRLVDNLSSIVTEEITISFPGMHRVVLDGAGGRGQGDVAFDNFVFGPVVPEPGSTTLGCIAAAFLLFRRTRRASCERTPSGKERVAVPRFSALN